MKLRLFFAAFLSAIAFGSPWHAAADDSKADAEGLVSLFNGKVLTGWKGLPDYWTVKDGAISGYETKDKSKQTFLVHESPVKDFELRLSFRFAPVNGKVDGNSGIQFRSKLLNEKAFVVGGYQADFDGGNSFTGIIYDEAGVAGGRGIMSKRGEKTIYASDANSKKPMTSKLEKSDADLKKGIKVGDWNEVVLIAKGSHIIYRINGQVTTEMIDDSPKSLKEGVLALQLHAGYTMDVQFKNIRIKRFE
jgi:hypothetical protein